jgi:hypothetical protein
MNKHTPGPWVVAEEAKIKHPQGTFIAQAQYWPDAYLIAAAPELLEALKSLLWYVGQLEMLVYSADDAGEHEEVAKACAAIAKAEPKNT